MKVLLSLLAMLSVLPVVGYADDTEIYINNTSDSNIRPNVMFIIDSSGSMATRVNTAAEPYDPDKTYPKAQPWWGRYATNKAYEKVKSQDQVWSRPRPVACSSAQKSLESVGTFTGKLNAVFTKPPFYARYIFDRYECHDPSLVNGTTVKEEAVTLWLGNYVNYRVATKNFLNIRRIDVVGNAFQDVIGGLNGVNVGLMHFAAGGKGGIIDVPMSKVEDVRNDLIKRVKGIYPSAQTPLTGTVHEAKLYFNGENALYGKSGHKDAFTNTAKTTYQSPITESCQKNHIVLFTDGEPTSDRFADAQVRTMLANISGSKPADVNPSCKYSYPESCLDELAYSLNNGDFSDKPGSQNIQLHTIGGFDETLMKSLRRTAQLGGGKYYSANDAKEISFSLTEILTTILSENSTFTAPAVSVNAFNTSEHRDELFYALFRPEVNVRWGGNVKKYRISDSGIVYGQDDSVPAISRSTGFFNDVVFDYWNNTKEPDGRDIELGGFSNRFKQGYGRRTALTIYQGVLTDVLKVPNKDMKTLLGDSEMDGTQLWQLKRWIYGYDVNDEDGDGKTNDSRRSIGDPLHSEPLIVTYGGTADRPDATLFFGTNEGYIHAVRTDTKEVEEHFAFIPDDLLANQFSYLSNTESASRKPYGMDGLISAWVYDKNDDNRVLSLGGGLQSGEHVYLYAGMRRGGRNYYALDVSNRSEPKLLFKINGGKGDFKKLGQTWSKMSIAKVKWKNKSKFVAFFSGGYDTNQDSNSTRQGDSLGNAVYMVDAESGERLWWASNAGADFNISQMDNSIPASLSLVDIDGDEHIDYFFAADTGGRLIRFDINQENTGKSNFAKGGVIASLSGDSEKTNRRFYNKPDISLVKDKARGDYLAIAIGSGHRPGPISTTTVKNRMYVVRDFHPYSAPGAYVISTEAPESSSFLGGGDADPHKLYNVTALMKGTPLTDDYQRMLNTGGGWYITFDVEGEKVLSESVTFNGVLLFSTFSPTGGSSGPCGPDRGKSTFYALSLNTAAPVLDLDDDGDIDGNDSKTALSHSGIAPRPVVIFRKDGGRTIAIGTETVEDSRFKTNECTGDNCPKQYCVNDCVLPVYWRQNDEVNKSKSM